MAPAGREINAGFTFNEVSLIIKSRLFRKTTSCSLSTGFGLHEHKITVDAVIDKTAEKIFFII
jgi:hypothetical protein